MISFSCANVKLSIVRVTVNELIAKIPWGFKDVCVFVSHGCRECKLDK